MFRKMSKHAISIVAEPSVELQIRVIENMFALKDLPSKSQKTLYLWFQLFSNILYDKQLTKKLWNILKGTLETEGVPQDLIVSNLPERNTSRIQRRK
jgi:hypothetical protein